MRIISDNLSYIDFRVLAILLALMIIVAGVRSTGFFELAVNGLLRIAGGTKSLVLYLVLACFVVSMLMTNDVALITFVPFAIMVMEKVGRKELLVKCVVFQTIAANLGSMLTPIGNPQNLYLYSKSRMGLMEFFEITFPYAILSLVLLIVCCVVFVKSDKIDTSDAAKSVKVDWERCGVYGVLFCVAVGSVLHILDYRIMLGLVLVVVAALNYKLIGKADYKLLLTFIVLFLIIGNVKNIETVSSFISKYVKGNEVIWSVALSQGISNVPAAMLLAGFTDNLKALVVGTNLGGLGTLIASMASLISYKAYCGSEGSRKGRYLVEFTAFNVAFLVILMIMYFVILK